MTLATLRAMALGGMRDHLGGGFHRYSVDAAWRVPHFEKMLYDQAQPCSRISRRRKSPDPFFADVATDTLDYVRRDLTHPEGGFYSAEDADSVRRNSLTRRRHTSARAPFTSGATRRLAPRLETMREHFVCDTACCPVAMPVRSAERVHAAEPAIYGAIG